MSQNTQQCLLPIPNMEALRRLLETHFEVTMAHGVLPSIRIDKHGNAVVFVSNMEDASQLVFKIDQKDSAWVASIEVNDGKMVA